MKTSKMFIGGGLVLALGAFGPAVSFASSSAKPIKASYTDSARTTPSSSDTADQSENENLPNSSASQAATESNTQENQMGANSSDLSEWESHLGNQIHRLDTDLSDAESYEAQGREDLNKNDTTAARRDFRTAEHALNMAASSVNSEPGMLGLSPAQQERMTERAVRNAKGNGQDVIDAQSYLADGKDALKQGDQMKACRDFRAADLALGIPVEVGYAEVWEAEVPVSKAANNTTANQVGSSDNGPAGLSDLNSKNDMNGYAKGGNLGDARDFLHDGQLALKNGDKTEAQRDFRAADRALSMNEEVSNSNSSDNYSKSTTADPASVQ